MEFTKGAVMENNNQPQDKIVVGGVEYVKTDTLSPPNASNTEPLDFKEKTNAKDKMWLTLVLLVVLSFVIPGLGIISIPAIAYFASHGSKKMEKNDIEIYGKRTASSKLFKLIGWIAMSIIMGVVGIIILIIILFSSSDFKIG